MKVVPLGDRVLVLEEKQNKEKKTAAGIILPESVKEDQGARRGKVVAAGPGRHEEGKRVPVEVKEGDTVLFSWGDTLKIDGEEYHLVSENNILAIVKK
ncbi:MAG: co-chaperone GroES [Parcubacteria group bacterium CG11_big_fil_rev_8_21_14_0_20_39_22]|nr:MAG: co-chaperone GroES [Parcubacteria group bacterium CG11_big_fil_rev_8_21_14_0_20_39_22]